MDTRKFMTFTDQEGLEIANAHYWAGICLFWGVGLMLSIIVLTLTVRSDLIGFLVIPAWLIGMFWGRMDVITHWKTAVQRREGGLK